MTPTSEANTGRAWQDQFIAAFTGHAPTWSTSPVTGIHRDCRYCRHFFDQGDRCDHCGGPR